MLIIRHYPDNSVSALQGDNLGSLVPVYGDLQKLILCARKRREPVKKQYAGNPRLLDY
jgi:hypothetical protein